MKTALLNDSSAVQCLKTQPSSAHCTVPFFLSSATTARVITILQSNSYFIISQYYCTPYEYNTKLLPYLHISISSNVYAPITFWYLKNKTKNFVENIFHIRPKSAKSVSSEKNFYTTFLQRIFNCRMTIITNYKTTTWKDVASNATLSLRIWWCKINL